MTGDKTDMNEGPGAPVIGSSPGNLSPSATPAPSMEPSMTPGAGMPNMPTMSNMPKDPDGDGTGRTGKQGRTRGSLPGVLLRLALLASGLVVLLVAALVGVFGLLQTESGQRFLEARLNEALAPSGVRLSHLKGSLPLDVSLDVSLADTDGEWLSIRGLALAFDFGKFPSTLGLSLEAESARLSFLPKSAATNEDEETASASLDLAALARALVGATDGVPDFVPGLVVNTLSVHRLEIERALYDQVFCDQLFCDQLSRDPMSGEGQAEALNTTDREPTRTTTGQAGPSTGSRTEEAADRATAAAAAAHAVRTQDATAVVVALQGIAHVLPDAEQGWSDPALAADISVAAFPRLPEGSPGPAGVVELEHRLVFQDVDLDLATVHLVLDGTLHAPRAVAEVRVNSCRVMGHTLEKAAVRLVLHEDVLAALADGQLARATFLVDTFLDSLPARLVLPLGLGMDKDIATLTIAPRLLAQGLELDGELSALVPACLAPGVPQASEEGTHAPAKAEAADTVPPVASLEDAAHARAAGLPLPLPDSLETFVHALNGTLSLRLGNCPLLARFLGETSIQGRHALDLSFAKDGEAPQRMELAFKGEGTRITSGTTNLVALTSVELLAALDSLDPSRAVADISLSAQNATLEGMDPFSLAGTLRGPLDAIDVRLESTGGVVSHVQGTISPLNTTASLSRLSVQLPAFGCGIRMDSPVTLTFGRQTSVDNLSLVLQPQGSLTLSMSLDDQRVAAQGALSRIDTAAWSAVVPGLPKGSVDARINVTGTPVLPQGSLDVALRDLELGVEGLPPLSADVTVELMHSGGASQGSSSQESSSQGSSALARIGVALHEDTRTKLGLETFVCEAAIPLESNNGQLSLGGNAALKGNVDIRGSLDTIWLLARQPNRRLTGRFQVGANLSGTLEAPAGTASATVDNALFSDLQYGVQIRRIAASLDANFPGSFEGAHASFSLSAEDGRRRKGTFEAQGQTDLKTITAKARLREFAPVRRRDIRAVLSADCTVTGPLTAPDVKGQVRVERGRIQLDALELPASVTTLKLVDGPKERILADRRAARKRTAEEKKAAQIVPAGTLDLSLGMEKFFVGGYGLDSEWKADMKMDCPLNAVGITGQIEAIRGSLDLLNRRFTLEEGTVTFAGGLEPVLNMEMTSSAGDIEAAIVVSGTPARLDLNLRSTPTLPKNDILAYMLFGKPANELSQFELLRLGATAASFAAFGAGGGSGLAGLARQAMGLDVLNLSQENGQTQLEMGRYLMDRLYVGVKQGTSEDSDTAGVIQFELGPRTSTTMEVGNGNTSIGWKWKLDY